MKLFALMINGVLLLALLCASVLAQARNTSLHGTVTDASGAIISKARVVIRNQSGFVVRSGASNERGEFSFDNRWSRQYFAHPVRSRTTSPCFTSTC